MCSSVLGVGGRIGSESVSTCGQHFAEALYPPGVVSSSARVKSHGGDGRLYCNAIDP